MYYLIKDMLYLKHKYLVYIVLVTCTAVTHGDDDDGVDWSHKGLVRLRTRLYHLANIEQNLIGSFEELKAFLNGTFGPRIERIEKMLVSLERRKLKAELCTPYTCNGHGTCDLSMDWQDTVCECNRWYKGKHCEIRAVCDIAVKKAALTRPGTFIPRCTPDGLYAPVQYSGTRAICYSAVGLNLGYGADRWSTDGMNCQCARDQYAYHFAGLIGKRFSCADNGNYAPVLCLDGFCSCQDATGTPYGKSIPFGVTETLKC